MAAQDATKRKKQRKVVMEGQTDEERRVLRQKQRKLLDRMQERHVEMTQLESGVFAEERQANNNLFDNVRFNREMGTDGENMLALAEAAKERSAKLATSVVQYSATQVVAALTEAYGKRRAFDWSSLGRECAPLFQAVPEMGFLVGPLNKPGKEVKERRKREKRVAQDDDDNQATEFEVRSGAANDQEDKDEATNMRLDHIHNVMETRMVSAGLPVEAPVRDAPKPGIDLFELLVNKDSFSETVENFFDLSFLVKDGHACVEIDPSSGLPQTRLTTPPEESVPKTQNVVVLSMADMANVADLWKLQSPALTRPADTAE